MMTKDTLEALKKKMPYGYAQLVITAYQTRYNESLSRWTVGRFFKGEAYTEKLHNAILDVATMQQDLMEKTEALINE